MIDVDGSVWRLLDTGPRSAAENVALDQALLEAKAGRDASGRRLPSAPNTLRFMQFDPPAVLIGYHQDAEEEARLAFCRENGIEIGRRITGGGAIFFDRTQIGWEIIAAKDAPGIPRSIEEIYRLMCEGAVSGLRKLGIAAAFRPRNDIEVDGRKISGTGGTDLGGALLFQGTLLMDFDVETMLRALRIPVEKLKDKEVASVKKRVTCVREQLGYLPSRDEVLQALTAGFAETLGVSFAPGDLLPEEAELAAHHLPAMQSEEYIFGLRASAVNVPSFPLSRESIAHTETLGSLDSRESGNKPCPAVAPLADENAILGSTGPGADRDVRPYAVADLRVGQGVGQAPHTHFQENDKGGAAKRHLVGRAELRSIYKAPGGLIRATLVVDSQRQRIKSALITGDFFAFPKRAIFDLEARLKDAPAEHEAIARIIECFFAETGPLIPGVAPDDLLKTIDEALRKLEYPTRGIPPGDINSVFTVVEDYESIPKPKALLLPYCAKLPDCALRYEEGCVECGLCSVGDAFALARRHGLEPITIQNYEHLEDTLRACLDRGITGFVGCCCEAFLAKHRDDFERIGLPGVLVDLDNVTCYDLGREDDAHHGRFDRLTHLKLDLLEKVIASVENGPQKVR